MTTRACVCVWCECCALLLCEREKRQLQTINESQAECLLQQTQAPSDPFDWPQLDPLRDQRKIEHVRLRTQTTGATKGCLLLSHTRNVTSCRWQGWVVDPSSWHTDSSRTSRMLPGKRQGQRPKIYPATKLDHKLQKASFHYSDFISKL